MMDSILHYTSVSHAGSLMAGINKMRVNADLCDVTVVVGDYRILAHKIILSASSPFFYQMLRIDARPAAFNSNEILLESVDEIAALKIIEFCYTSAISLDDNTVWPLLETAIKFQFAEICSLCCEFLTAGLDVSNCLLSLQLAARLRFSQLEDNCVRFLVDNLVKTSSSQDLVCLSAQDLSSILSILEIHRTPVDVIATLAQAWLDWDRKSRTVFLPKLKLLLPALGDFMVKNCQDIIPDKDISITKATDGTNSKIEDENFSKGSTAGQFDSKREQTSQVVPETELQTVGANCQNSNSKSNSNVKNMTSVLGTINSSFTKIQRDSSATGQDFICVSCGDEFACTEDLAAHGHLCDESVRIVKNKDMKDMISLPTGSNLEKTISEEAVFENSQNNDLGNIQKEVSKTSLKNSDSTIPSVKNKFEILTEPSYPKTRRSLRNRKIEERNIDSLKEKSGNSNEGGSLPKIEESKDNNNKSLTETVYETEKTELDPTSQSADNTEKEDRHMEAEQRQTRIENSEVKKYTIKDNIPHNTEEATIAPALSVNDNNNNDVLLQESGSHDQPMNSSLENKRCNIDTVYEATSSNDRSVVQNTISCHRENGGMERKQEIDHVESTEDNRGSSTLRQWRQEHLHLSPNNLVIQSSAPNHKCLICGRGFWDRKALASHWRQNHGVQSIADEEEEYSCSDVEMDTKPSNASKRKSQSPRNAYLPSQNVSSLSNSGSSKSDVGPNVRRNLNAKSYSPNPLIPNSNPDLTCDLPTSQSGKHIHRIQKVKEEICDGKEDSKSFNLKNVSKNFCSSQSKESKAELSQTLPKQPPFETNKSDSSQPVNPSHPENWMRGTPWSQESSENAPQGADGGKPSQNLNSATSEFFNNYFNQYNKLAEWWMTQGAHFCPMCMGYHSLGKPCPKSVAHKSPDMNGDRSRGEFSVKDKEAKDTEVKKEDNEEEGPLDMSKSSGDFSNPSSSNSSKSSSVNSSSHSSILGGPPFFNYSHLMSDSDVLDMSTQRYGDSKLIPLQPNSLALPHRKSPLDPNASFGASYSPYQPQFSTAPPLSSPNAGPSNSTSPNTSTPIPSLPKSSALPKKKVTSRQGFPCTVCNRVFSYQTALFTHMHTHSPSARSYRCQLCNESFARAPDLKVHVCPNGMEKPYSCPSCGQTFAKNIHLKRHLATHSGLKPYPCWVCGKRFSRSDHLKRHTQSIHAGARPHVCQVCGKEFVRKYELNKHMQSHEQSYVVST